MTNITSLKLVNRFFATAGFIVAAFALLALPSVSHAETLNRQLSLGMSGADVSALQAFLAQDNTIYPQGLVTGYFGILTQAAVSNFQSRNGIATVGRVGPQTLLVLNLQISQGSQNLNAPIISSVGVSTYRNSAVISWNTNENAKGVVYYSSSPLMTNEHPHSVDVSGDTAMTDAVLRITQNVTVQNLSANTVYYYLVYTTDADGNVSVTWPATFQTTN